MNRVLFVLTLSIFSFAIMTGPNLQADPPSGMVLIPGGEFEMGCHIAYCYSNEQPVHAVYIDTFYMDILEVTNQQYCEYLNSAFRLGLIEVIEGVVYKKNSSEPYCWTYPADMGSRIHLVVQFEDPLWLDEVPPEVLQEEAQIQAEVEKTFQGENRIDITFWITPGKADHPMMEVTWYGAAAYANWRSEQDGKTPCYDMSTWECNFGAGGYRLPTEAEWEYAARGGEHDPYYKYPWGDDIDGSKANYWDSGDPYEGDPVETAPVGYYDGNQTPPGSDMANGYGLYDMSGNIAEWCNDWYDGNYYPVSPYDNPRGPASGNENLVRGGSWCTNLLGRLRSVRRGYLEPDRNGHCIGFRLVLN